jgi:hypothetical protein
VDEEVLLLLETTDLDVEPDEDFAASSDMPDDLPLSVTSVPCSTSCSG